MHPNVNAHHHMHRTELPLQLLQRASHFMPHQPLPRRPPQISHVMVMMMMMMTMTMTMMMMMMMMMMIPQICLHMGF